MNNLRNVWVMLTVILVGCGSGYVRDESMDKDLQYCGMISNVSELLDIYVTERDSRQSLAGVIPNTPVRAALGSDINRSIHLLAEQMTNDVTAIRSVLFTVIVLRNMAPCDPDNIALSWAAVNNAIGALERHYGVSNAILD